MSTYWTTAGLVAVSLAGGITYIMPEPPPAPAVTNVRVLETRAEDNRVGIRLEWFAREGCKFEALTSVQGNPNDPHGVHVAIEREIALRGPRGAGLQIMASNEWWWFTEPQRPFQAPVFILDAWHVCGDKHVRSPMLRIPMVDFFERDHPSG